MIRRITRACLALAVTTAFCGIAPAGAAPVAGQGTWETTLQARDLNGDGIRDAFYDTALNITWLADGNANLVNANLVPNVYVGGNMTWGAAVSWADTLSIGGYSNWRLPKIMDTGSVGCNFSVSGGTDCGYNVQTASGSTVYSEMAHLFFNTLGNISRYTTAGVDRGPAMGIDYGLLNSGPFDNFDDVDSAGVPTYYWLGSDYAPNSVFAWALVPVDGGQYFFSKVDLSRPRLAIAVHDGDIGSPIPEPEIYAMLLAGLGMLGWAKRRGNRTKR